MQIVMLATSASPRGVYHAGYYYDVSRKEAERLCTPGLDGRVYARKENCPANTPKKLLQLAVPVQSGASDSDYTREDE